MEVSSGSSETSIRPESSSGQTWPAGGIAEAGHLPSFLDHVRRHFRYIIINGGAELAVPVLIEALARSDRAFLLL